jgi:hypothetical protein
MNILRNTNAPVDRSQPPFCSSQTAFAAAFRKLTGEALSDGAQVNSNLSTGMSIALAQKSIWFAKSRRVQTNDTEVIMAWSKSANRFFFGGAS